MVLLCGHTGTGTPTTEFPAEDLNQLMTTGKRDTNYITHELLLVMVTNYDLLKPKINITISI